MRVRREVDRQVVFKMQPVAVEFGEKTLAERCGHLLAQQMPDPYPRQRPEPDLERTGPVYAALKLVLRPPVLQLADHCVEVLDSPGDHESLRQLDKMLMPVDLPDQLVFSRSCQIEIEDCPKILLRSLNTALRIAPPRDRRPVIDHIAEHGNPALDDYAGQSHQFARIVGIAQGVANPARR